MAGNRVVVAKDSFLAQGKILYICPQCGAEVVGDENYFMDKIQVINYVKKDDVVCPSCGSPIVYGDDYYLDLSDFRRYAMCGCVGGLEALDYAMRHLFGTEIYYSIKDNKFKVYNNEDAEIVKSRGEELVRFQLVDEAFSFLRNRKWKEKESVINQEIDSLIEKSEKAPIINYSIDINTIKKDPEKLKDYISHLVNIESDIYACRQRLAELYHTKYLFEENLPSKLSQLTEDARKKVKQAKGEMAFLPTAASFASRRPKEPREPNKPVYQQPGLFNRSRVNAENEQLKRIYEKELIEYKSAMQEYDIALQRFNRQTEEKIKKAKEEVERKIDEATRELNDIINNASEESYESILLNKEIRDAKETLQKLINGKNELYSLDIVFGKYRNFVALSSFYEYLLSGRCESLEGANGAYNIYEAEIRANQIIAQLSEVLSSLDQIKEHQFTAYSKLQSIQSDLTELNSLTATAIDSIDNTTEAVESLSANSEVIAYNSAQAAFYERKNNDLIKALGLLVALK